MRLFKKGILLVLLAALVVNLLSNFGSGSTVNAVISSKEVQEPSNANQDPSDAILEATKNLSQISIKEQKVWRKLAKKQIKNGTIKVDTRDLLDFSKSNVYRLNDSDYYIVGIPIVSEDYHEMSNVSIFYNAKDLSVDQVTEYQIKRSPENTFQLIMSLNGEEQLNEVTTDEFTTAAEFQEKIHTKGFSWSKFKKCSGVTDATARLLAYLCGATCVITLGTACIWCITGAVGALGGLSATCIGEAWT